MGMFSSLHSLLVTHSENVKLLRTAVFLIISLVANNGNVSQLNTSATASRYK